MQIYIPDNKIENAATKDLVRKNMQHVLIEDGLFIVTDGHIMIVQEIDGNEYDGLPHYITTESIKYTRKLKKDVITLKDDKVIVVGDNGEIAFSQPTDIEKRLKWKSVIPFNKSSKTISFNASLLKTLATSLGNDNITLEIPEKEFEAIVVKSNSNGDRFGLLMPIRQTISFSGLYNRLRKEKEDASNK